MKAQIDAFLAAITALDEPSTIIESMNYSLLSEGKRIRPLMLLTLLDDYDVSWPPVLPVAAALEMVHTYSLIHDDLPSIDNDDYRRFRLTNHKVYGEAMAVLAGDALLTGAFAQIATAKLSDHHKVACMACLSKMAGYQGMILGQELDLNDRFLCLEELDQCYRLKTGCMFVAAIEMAVVLADRQHLIPVAHELGYKLGMAFQYQDDLLECRSDLGSIGKSKESDKQRNKKTIVSFVGIDEAQVLCDELFAQAQDLMALLQTHHSGFQQLVESIKDRKL